jgi:hypothetical protein
VLVFKELAAGSALPVLGEANNTYAPSMLFAVRLRPFKRDQKKKKGKCYVGGDAHVTSGCLTRLSRPRNETHALRRRPDTYQPISLQKSNL